MEEEVEVERLVALVAHQDLGLQAGARERDGVDQAEGVRPGFAQVHGEVLGAEAEVDLDRGLVLAGLAEQLPFADAGEAVLGEGGGGAIGGLAEYLRNGSVLCI